VHQSAEFELQTSMIWGWGRAHNYVTMAVSFDAPFELCHLAVGEQFCPAAQIELRLLLLKRQFYRERSHS
jgi:hypothetical protein